MKEIPLLRTLVGAIGLVGTFFYSAARNTRALYRAEPIPARKEA